MSLEIKRDIDPEHIASSPDPPVRAPAPPAPPAIPQALRTRIKILFLAVNGDATTAANLKLDEEYRAIDASAARQPGKLELASKWAVQRSELQQGLLQHMPDVVHFAGHGTSAGELMLRDERGEFAKVSPDALTSLFATLRDNIQLVVLNACFSVEQASAIRDSVGVAIGMRRQISDRAATVFSSAFYEALAYQRSVREAFDLGVTAIRTHGLGSEADVPQLLVRAGIDVTAMYLIAARRPSVNPADRDTMRVRTAIFAALFLAAVMFALLFGVGVIRQNAVSEYIVFVLLGALAAVLTWGILSSSGELRGAPYAINIKLAGSIVPLIIIAAGGLLMAHSEADLAIKVKLVDDAGLPVKVSGLARLEIEADVRTVPVERADLIEFDHLPRALGGKEATFTLESSTVRVGAPGQRYQLEENGLITIHVRPIPIMKISGTVSFQGERVPGGMIAIIGRDCIGEIRAGYFDVPCETLKLPTRVQIRLPEIYAGRVCTHEVPVGQLVDNDLVLLPCEPGERGSDSAKVPSLSLCNIDGDSPPNAWTGRCPRPDQSLVNASLLSEYKRRWPTLRRCRNVVIYTCP